MRLRSLIAAFALVIALGGAWVMLSRGFGVSGPSRRFDVDQNPIPSKHEAQGSGLLQSPPHTTVGRTIDHAPTRGNASKSTDMFALPHQSSARQSVSIPSYPSLSQVVDDLANEESGGDESTWKARYRICVLDQTERPVEGARIVIHPTVVPDEIVPELQPHTPTTNGDGYVYGAFPQPIGEERSPVYAEVSCEGYARARANVYISYYSDEADVVSENVVYLQPAQKRVIDIQVASPDDADLDAIPWDQLVVELRSLTSSPPSAAKRGEYQKSYLVRYPLRSRADIPIRVPDAPAGRLRVYLLQWRRLSKPILDIVIDSKPMESHESYLSLSFPWHVQTWEKPLWIQLPSEITSRAEDISIEWAMARFSSTTVSEAQMDRTWINCPGRSVSFSAESPSSIFDARIQKSFRHSLAYQGMLYFPTPLRYAMDGAHPSGWEIESQHDFRFYALIYSTSGSSSAKRQGKFYDVPFAYETLDENADRTLRILTLPSPSDAASLDFQVFDRDNGSDAPFMVSFSYDEAQNYWREVLGPWYSGAGAVNQSSPFCVPPLHVRYDVAYLPARVFPHQDWSGHQGEAMLSPGEYRAIPVGLYRLPEQQTKPQPSGK